MKAKRKPGRPRLSTEELHKRGTFRHHRHGDGGWFGAGVAEDRWLVGLDRDCRIQAAFYLQYWEPLDRLAFRRLLRAHSELEQHYRSRPPGPWQPAVQQARVAEGERLRARIAALVREVGWRYR